MLQEYLHLAGGLREGSRECSKSIYICVVGCGKVAGNVPRVSTSARWAARREQGMLQEYLRLQSGLWEGSRECSKSIYICEVGGGKGAGNVLRVSTFVSGAEEGSSEV